MTIHNPRKARFEQIWVRIVVQDRDNQLQRLDRALTKAGEDRKYINKMKGVLSHDLYDIAKDIYDKGWRGLMRWYEDALTDGQRGRKLWQTHQQVESDYDVERVFEDWIDEVFDLTSGRTE